MSADSVAGYTLLLQISKNSRHETNYHILLRNLIGICLIYLSYIIGQGALKTINMESIRIGIGI